jgi:hypothetical protein
MERQFHDSFATELGSGNAGMHSKEFESLMIVDG